MYAIERGGYMRVNMNIPDELVKHIDEQAKSLNISRSAYVVMTMSQKVQSDIILNSMPDLKRAISAIETSIKDKGARAIE